MISRKYKKIRKNKSRGKKKNQLPISIFQNKIFKCFKGTFYGNHVDKDFYSHSMGVSYFKKMAVKTERQGWMWKKFKIVDAGIGQIGEQNQKIEAVNKLAKMGECSGVEKLSVFGENEDIEDVVILSEHTRLGGSVC